MSLQLLSATLTAVSPASQHTTMQIIASSNGFHDRTAAAEKSGQRFDKHGRPLMSARRSATSSSRTITRSDLSTTPNLPTPGTSQDHRSVQDSVDPEGGNITEASAYARAVASDLARPGLKVSQTRTNSSGTISHVADGSRGARPLPRPPNSTTDGTHSPVTGGHSPGMAQANSQKSLERVAQSGLSPANTPLKPRRESGINFDFPRSPTLPALVDPRNASPKLAETRPNEPNGVLQTPPRSNTARPPAPSVSDGAKAVNGAEIRLPRGKVPLHHLLSHPAIQSSLLSAIGINTFLSLTGSSEDIRHQFTGESVGRWVLREWRVETPQHLGIRWPNLTVWEGFRESRERFVADLQLNHCSMTPPHIAHIRHDGTIYSGT